MNVKTYYSIRLLARIIDIFLVSIIVLAINKVSPQFEINLLLPYFLYNVLTVLLQGKTLGKYSLSIQIKNNSTSVKQLFNLILREILLFILLPVLFLNFICMTPVPLHDRISGTKVFKNGT